jgi:hypothetical protein
MATKYQTPSGLHYRIPCPLVDGNGNTHHHGGRMTPEAFEALPGCSLVEVPDPVPATQADIDQADAIALAVTHPELPATLRDCLEALHDATHLGVDLDLSLGLPGWDLLGNAFADAILPADDPRPLMALELRARGAWLHYQHHAGSPETAYRLAQEIAQLP